MVIGCAPNKFRAGDPRSLWRATTTSWPCSPRTSLRYVATTHPYDDDSDEGTSLRGSTDVVSDELAYEVAARIAVAVVEIIEVRISHLADAPGIAQVMLKRQRAGLFLEAPEPEGLAGQQWPRPSPGDQYRVRLSRYQPYPSSVASIRGRKREPKCRTLTRSLCNCSAGLRSSNPGSVGHSAS